MITDARIDQTVGEVGQEIDQAVEIFTQPSITSQPMLMEVFTEKDKDIEHLKTYYHNLKK